MRVLIAAMEFSTLTGAPMYHYNLAKGLTEKGHKVICVGLHSGGDIKDMLEQLGVIVYDYRQMKVKNLGHFDLAIIAENIPEYLDYFTADKIFNICHSKDEADRPILDTRIDRFIAPRTQISDRWLKEYDDCELEFEILPIPINFDKFTFEKEKQDKYIILAPCGRCELRRPMLLDLIKRADKDTELWLVGDDYGGLDGVNIPDNVKIFPATKNIVDYFRKADEVAGIFIGTVTIEAWIAGIKTSVYDEQGNWQYVEPDKDLQKYNYKNVVEKLCQI